MAERTTIVFDEGRRDGVPVVFLHAFPLHSGMWRAQREALKDHARCIAIDVRGLGPGAPVAGAFMLEHLVDDLLVALDGLELGAAVLCGLSMGGYVALRAVERAPERVRGLFLADTQAAADGDAAKLARAEGLRALGSKGVAAYADAQLARVLSPTSHAERPAVVAAAKQLIIESSAEGIASALVALATRTDVTESLARIEVPTRVVVGEHDAVTPPAVAHALADTIPGADLQVLPGAGHLANLEVPDLFNRSLLELLKRVP